MPKRILSLLRLPKLDDHLDFSFVVPEIFERKILSILLPYIYTLATHGTNKMAEAHLKNSRLMLFMPTYT
jgi:hypothetical protein